MKTNKVISFNTNDSVVALWVFKSSKKRFFTVKIGSLLIDHLKTLPSKSFEKINTLTQYDAAASQNKDVALTYKKAIASWNSILDHLKQPVEKRYVRTIAGLQNNFAYIATFKHEGKVLYAAKKISTNLGSKKSSSFIDSIFNGETLELTSNPVFGISKLIDFYYIEDTFYILNKDNFESILGFRELYKKEYEELINSQEFNDLFEGIPVLQNYVKDNATQLGRMYSIKQKAKFKDKDYMKAFFEYNETEKWGIQVKNGKIIFTEEKVRDIINIMLGHRVKSLCDREISDAAGLIKVSNKF